MINFKKLSSLLFCIYIGSSFGSTLLAQPGQIFGGRIIQGRPIQGQIIQGQPAQGQIIQGQPIQGQIIQGQPIQGQIIQGPIIQGPIIQGQPIQGRIIQAPVIQGQPVQQAPAGKITDAAKAKIDELNKRIKALDSLKVTNEKLQKDNNTLKNEAVQLKQAYGEVNQQLVELRKASMNSADQQDMNAGLQKQFDELRAQYQTAVKQNDSNAGKVAALTQENSDLKKRIENVGQNQGNMSDLQRNLSSASTRVTELETQNQKIVTQNRTLIQKNEELTQGNGQLQTRAETIRMELEKLQSQNQMTSEENAALNERITALSAENENQATMLSDQPEEIPEPEMAKIDYRKTRADSDSELAAENAQFSKLNAELESDNSLLRAQISELQGEVNGLNLAAETKGSTLANLTPAIPSSGSGKYNVKYWIIPFLLIGLGVGLYTYFMEEHRGVGTTETRQNV